MERERMRIQTGDIVRAIKLVFPEMTADMVRNAIDIGGVISRRNPFATKRPNHFYDGDSLREFILNNENIKPEDASLILKELGLNFNQLKLVKSM